MGPIGLEPMTSSLSGTRSNQLSYEPCASEANTGPTLAGQNSPPDCCEQCNLTLSTALSTGRIRKTGRKMGYSSFPLALMRESFLAHFLAGARILSRTLFYACSWKAGRDSRRFGCEMEISHQQMLPFLKSRRLQPARSSATRSGSQLRNTARAEARGSSALKPAALRIFYPESREIAVRTTLQRRN